MITRKRIYVTIVAVALGGLCNVLAQSDAVQSNAPRSDGQIEMDVVRALDGSQALKDDLITALVALMGTAARWARPYCGGFGTGTTSS